MKDKLTREEYRFYVENGRLPIKEELKPQKAIQVKRDSREWAAILRVNCKFPSLNEYTNANRSSKHSGASVKKKFTNITKDACIKQNIQNFRRVVLDITWVEKNKRRDKDNISFGKKFLFDGMVAAGVLKNDGWGEVENWSENFMVDKDWQGVIVKIKEY